MTHIPLHAPASERSVRSKLLDFTEELRQELRESLQSVVLYGGLAKGDFTPFTSDVNVMIVLRYAGLAELDRAAPVIQKAVRDFHLAPLLLTARDLQRSADVFSTKFLDMQRNHQVLFGDDLLAGLAISPEHLRLRAEQQVKNLMLRLRHYYVLRSPRPEWIESTLNRAFSSLLSSLGILLQLKTGSAPTAKSALADAAVSQFDLNQELMHGLLSLRTRNQKPDEPELHRMYGALMSLVERVADIVDTL